MKIKRFEIVEDSIPGYFRVVDRLKDDFVCVPLIENSREFLEELMGKRMKELVDSTKVHPGYLKKSGCLTQPG